MESRPPTSIIVAVASASILGLMGIAASGWGFFRWLSAADRDARPSVMALVGIVATGVFIAWTLRRKRSVRIPAIAVALSLAVGLAVLTFTIAVSPGIADRASAVGALGMFATLATLIAVPLLRASARVWLNQ